MLFVLAGGHSGKWIGSARTAGTHRSATTTSQTAGETRSAESWNQKTHGQHCQVSKAYQTVPIQSSVSTKSNYYY